VAAELNDNSYETLAVTARMSLFDVWLDPYSLRLYDRRNPFFDIDASAMPMVETFKETVDRTVII
jgi:hypothetical protein